MGGVIKATSLSSLLINNISASLLTISGTYYSNYEGVFLYMDNIDSLEFSVQVSNSEVTCKATNSLFSLTPSSSSSATYYSLFYIQKKGQAVNLSSQNNTYSNCYTAANGGIYNVNPNNLGGSVYFNDTNSSYSYISVASSGGAYFIQNALTFGFSNSTYSQISAGSHGGAVYAVVYDLYIDLIDIIADTVQSGGSGGFMYLYRGNYWDTYSV